MSAARSLWVDYQRTDSRGLTHASVRHLERPISLEPGMFIVVGNDDAEDAVAEVVEVDDAVVLVRVLPGPATEHLHLISTPRRSA